MENVWQINYQINSKLGKRTLYLVVLMENVWRVNYQINSNLGKRTLFLIRFIEKVIYLVCRVYF